MLYLPNGIDHKGLLDKMIKHSPVYYLLVDKHLRIVWVNRTLNGHPSEYIGKHVAENALDEDKETFVRTLTQCFKTSQPQNYYCRSKWGMTFAGRTAYLGKYILLIVWEHKVREGEKLTARESEIAEMVKRGMSSKQIAEALKISKCTVDNHRKKIKTKLAF